MTKRKRTNVPSKNVKNEKPKKPTAKLREDDKARYIAEVRRRSGMQVKQQENWVRNFAHITSTLHQEGYLHRPELVAVFWLRLHGILTEVKHHLIAPIEFLREAEGEFANIEADLPADMQTHLALRWQAYQAVLKVQECMTDDEIMFADVQRQTQAHVLQSKYDLQIRKVKGEFAELKDTYFLKALNREIRLAESDAAFARVFYAHGMNEMNAARACVFRRRRTPVPLIADSLGA